MAAGVYLHEGFSLEEELQLLEAIYIHELTIEGPRERPSSVSLLLHPSTGDEGDKQYVCLSLLLSLPLEYPNVLPSIEIKNPRGLSEAHIESYVTFSMSPYNKHPLVWGLRTSHFQSISLNLHELAETRIGSPMLLN
ncbi:predicted protein [Nematostella vectensis]|uniref:RWD domain-containing protein n=1 Tax=Nematostella vectensis TaxID=45351 RepID=A7RK97_NEMVE|nr:predicted protein [Nematostella vectensis]|eukprot:XP_001640194.1 predicted protein [Nematostella vectensis]